MNKLVSEIANDMSFGSTDSKTRNLDLKKRIDLQFCFRLSGREFQRSGARLEKQIKPAWLLGRKGRKSRAFPLVT